MTINSLDDITNVILFQIDRTSRMAKLYAQRVFDELGIDLTIDQWVLLKILHEEDGMSQKELAEKSSRDGASITRTLDILTSKGWVERGIIPENRRQYEIKLTLKGIKLVKENIRVVSAHKQKSIEGLEPGEVIAFQNALQKIQNNFR